MKACGEGTQCPALANAKLGFHVRGDTFGANRLLDTLLSGTVPIFTFKEQYDVLPDWFDWDKVSYFANVSSKESFLADVDKIMGDKKTYQEKLKQVLANRDLFDWETPIPFDTYMYMLSLHLWPELVSSGPKASSPYSALVLPHHRKQGQGYKAFDDSHKLRIWCGQLSGFGRDTCAVCMEGVNKTKYNCKGNCKWCDRGGTPKSVFNPFAVLRNTSLPLTPRDKCVHRSLTCIPAQPNNKEAQPQIL